MAQESHAIMSEGLHEARSVSMDVRLEEAITRLAARQSAYQASLLATTRVMQTSLVNYL